MKEEKYKGWIVSNKFWKRAVSLWLHVFVIQLIFNALWRLITWIWGYG